MAGNRLHQIRSAWHSAKGRNFDSFSPSRPVPGSIPTTEPGRHSPQCVALIALHATLPLLRNPRLSHELCTYRLIQNEVNTCPFCWKPATPLWIIGSNAGFELIFAAQGELLILQQNDPIIVIRQTDHAYLSGFFAREWGNKAFSHPEPSNSFCLAVSEHDNGWQEWELAPGVDPRTFAPYSFMTVPTEEHISLYQRGIDRLIKADLYSGLLVVSHCMGLYDRARATIPGYSAKYVKSQEQNVANDFVQRLRLQQLRIWCRNR